jgi:hypothetical protein
MILMATVTGELPIWMASLCVCFTSVLGLGYLPKWWDDLKTILEKGREDWKLSKDKLVPKEVLAETCRSRLDPLVELVDKAFYLWFVGGYIYAVISMALGLIYGKHEHLLGFLFLAVVTYLASKLVVSLEDKLSLPHRKYETFFALYV